MNSTKGAEEEVDGRICGRSVNRTRSVGDGNAYSTATLGLQNGLRGGGENTSGCTGIGVNLVVACTTVGDKLQALRQCIDQLLIEPSSQLLRIRYLSL